VGFPKRSHSTFVSVPKKPYNFTGGDLGNLGAPGKEKKRSKVYDKVKHALLKSSRKTYSKMEEEYLPHV